MKRVELLIRCDATPELGMGHVMRCLAIADACIAQGSEPPVFLMQAGSLGAQQVCAAGYKVHGLNPAQLCGLAFVQAVRSHNPAILLVDVRDNLSPLLLQRLRTQGIRIAVLDDASERRLAADMLFYPPVPQLQELDWCNFTGEKYIGWEWLPLRPEFAAGTATDSKREPPEILISLGGSDPHKMTLKVLSCLEQLAIPYRYRIVIGAACSDAKAIRTQAARLNAEGECVTATTDMASLMRQADVGILAFGMTAYEAAACGLPSLYICATADHACSAQALVQAGAGLSLGVLSARAFESLPQALLQLLVDRKLRTAMSAQASACIDGRGAQRIAARLLTSQVPYAQAGC